MARERTGGVSTESTTTTHKKGGEVVAQSAKTQDTPVPDIPTVHARVRVGGSVTRNLGDFESVRCEVMLELPCAPDDDAINEAYDRASLFVEDLVEKEINAADEFYRKG